MPRWYTDAKLGIFVHWGLYSIPALAERANGDYTAFMRDLKAGRHQGPRPVRRVAPQRVACTAINGGLAQPVERF